MDEDRRDNTREKRDDGKPVGKPFQAGNPGRPKGARNKLGEEFLSDLLADWQENGADVIATVRDEKPDQYLKVVASILPKELNVKVSELDELSDEQLQRQLAHIVAQLAAAGLDLIPGDAAAGGTQSPSKLPTVQ